MFAVVIAGRLVQSDMIQVEETKFMFTLTDLDNVNHIVVFMTGQQPFPDGIGGSVYINFSPSSSQGGWQLVGHLTNEKPSAIFKISGLQGEAANQNVFSDMSAFPAPNQSHHAQLGISLEPLQQLSQQVPATSGTSVAQGSTFVDFANKMLNSFYNYASSFTVSKEEIANAVMNNQLGSTASQTYFVPASVLETWQKQFESKLAHDINFWKK